MGGEKMPLQTYEEATQHLNPNRPVHGLLGNGFSRACRDDIFSYSALFDRADFNNLNPACRNAFEILGTRDFEQVIRALRLSSGMVRAYREEDQGLVAELERDAAALREVLVAAIAGSHPEWPGEIGNEAYAACKRFLGRFERIYTLSYDLLLYWAYMQEELEPRLSLDDGFRRPQGRDEDYVTWEIGNSYQQKVYYVHGALHLFDAGHELQKYTWRNTQRRLTDQIRESLEQGKFPLFVSEGRSEDKLDRIKHSGYLSRALASLPSITGGLVCYGFAFSENDEHVITMIEHGRLETVLVGLYGDENSESNRRIRARAEQMPVRRRNRARPRTVELTVHFFQAESARVWG